MYWKSIAAPILCEKLLLATTMQMQTGMGTTIITDRSWLYHNIAVILYSRKSNEYNKCYALFLQISTHVYGKSKGTPAACAICRIQYGIPTFRKFASAGQVCST